MMTEKGDELAIEGAQLFVPAPSSSLPARRVIIIDNYDSFTFNIVQGLLKLGAFVYVVPNDRIDALSVLSSGASHLVLSPGPGRPEESGVCQELCRALVTGNQILPTLGICLGHQSLCAVHGARVVRANRIMHGKVSQILHRKCGIFQHLENPFRAMRYHSLIVDESSLPNYMVAVAHTKEGELMAVQHRTRPLFGVQFHPESILSEQGQALFENFLSSPALHLSSEDNTVEGRP